MREAFFALVLVGVASIGIALPANAAPPKCFGRPATIVGTNGDDNLFGTNGSDVIVALGGFDIIDARRGRDFVCAGASSDGVFGRAGRDNIAGGGGFDAIFPGSGDDFINGGPRGDFVTYEGSSARVLTDLSSGVIFAQGQDHIRSVEGVGGGESDDVLVGTRGGNVLIGNGGDDVVVGRQGGDFLNTGAGDDIVRGEGGNDILDILTAHGGPGFGDDVFATSGAAVDMPSGTVTGGSDVGDDLFTGIENVFATLGDDEIIGTNGTNFLVAWDGDDGLEGRGGDDVLFPGPADDVVDGGAGADEVDYFFSDPFQVGVLGPVTVDLGAGSATGLGNDDLTSVEGAVGTLLDDTLIGSDGPNFLLLGDEGSDDISGEAGDDYLDGDAFFFGFPENLPGTDSLDGGPDQDVCFGGEITNECEVEGPALAQSLSAGRAATLDRYSALRQVLVRHYGSMHSH